jgi:hypothetical protein
MFFFLPDSDQTLVKELIQFRLKTPELHEATLMRLADLAEEQQDPRWFKMAMEMGADVNAPNAMGVSFAHAFLGTIDSQERLDLFFLIEEKMDRNTTSACGLRVVAFACYEADLGNAFFQQAVLRLAQTNPYVVKDLRPSFRGIGLLRDKEQVAKNRQDYRVLKARVLTQSE